MRKLVGKIIQYRWVIISIVIFVTIFFACQLKNLQINSDILSSLPDDDPTAQSYNEIGEQFGGNDIGIIVLETSNIFTYEVLQHVKQITDSLKINIGVSTVTSITNILDIKSSDWGIEIGNLVDEYDLPVSKQELDSLTSYVFSKELYVGSIVSEDTTATIILFTILPDADMQATASEVKSMVENLNLPEKIYYGGLPFMLIDITELIVSDMIWLIPIVFIIIAAVLLISFRTLQGMMLPLIVAGICVVWTLGLMALVGYQITIISNIAPVVLLAIGSAYTIHVLNSINIYSLNYNPKALIMAMSYTMIPVLLASLTTAIGFVSFVFGAYLTMIKDFGIVTAIGIVIALILSIFFVPAVISVLKVRQVENKEGIPQKKQVFSLIILQPIVKILFRYPKTVLIVWCFILILSIGGIFRIKTSVNITDYFKSGNPTRVTENILQEKFGGSLPTYVIFEGDVQDPEVLKTMIMTERFMKEDPNISIAQSVADLIEQMNDAMGEGKQIPDDKSKIEQLWFLLDGQDIMSQLVSNNLDKGIIQSKFASIKTNEIEAYTTRMKQFISNNIHNGFGIKFTGTPSLYVKLNDSLVKSQYSSLIIAIILVLFIVGLIMHSIVKGFYATIPILASITILLGFMGFYGIPLDIATVLVGSIALGIGIDYSIHVISGFNSHIKEYANTEKAIEETILTTGKAVIINVISVAAGFLVLLFSHIVPLQNFGLLIALNMFVSGLGALTLLPVILILSYQR